MNLKKIGIIILSCILCYSYTFAHDFAVTLDGQKIYFNIKSQKNKTVEVTYNGSITDKQPTNYVGELNIPAKIRHNNTIYVVTGINAKSFSGADKLTGVVIPMGVTYIGDFAFEGCTSLTKIVFPGNHVKFGQGVFFKCNKIQNVSFGSDWDEIDFKMFRWSDSLTTVSIPAKTEKIKNMKSLKHLETISVDINNQKFSSINGVLYDKNQKILYGCPRAYKGELKVSAQTNKITKGALIDCIGITKIDLPDSITSMSFRELSRMPNLEEIIFRGMSPIKTAQNNGNEVFLLQVENANVKISVPKNARNEFKNTMIQQTGEYTELDDETPYFVEKEKMPNIKNIKGIKNIDKYK